MQNKDTVQQLLDRITYRDWLLHLGEDDNRLWIQVQFYDKCNSGTGEQQLQKCRKWMLSRHMTDSEIIDTAYAAIERAVQHELREQFKVDDVSLYNPHIDFNHLVNINKTLSPDQLYDTRD